MRIRGRHLIPRVRRVVKSPAVDNKKKKQPFLKKKKKPANNGIGTNLNEQA